MRRRSPDERRQRCASSSRVPSGAPSSGEGSGTANRVVRSPVESVASEEVGNDGGPRGGGDERPVGFRVTRESRAAIREPQRRSQLASHAAARRMTALGRALRVRWPDPEPKSTNVAWRENRPTTGWFPGLRWHELWSFRELAFFLALRDLKLRYRQTAFGVAWAIIQPLAGAAIFTVVFGRLAHLPSDGIPYAVFVYSGLVLWSYFSTAVNSAAESLVQQRDLVTKVYFPRLLAPLAAVLPGLIDIAVSLVIVAAFLVIFSVVPTAAVLLVPLWVMAGVVVALAAGLWLSAINAQYRDARYALPFVMQLWLFASPVIYPSSLFEGAWRYLYAANPIVGVLDGFRWSLVGGPPPGYEALVSLAVGLLVLLGGVAYFRRAERRFADVI